MLFACERDAHEGALRAWPLPALPPDLRARLELAGETEPGPAGFVEDRAGRESCAH